MLVITRREGEEVVIGDPSNPIGVIRIAMIRGDRVRIAFDFPRSVKVYRRELQQQIADDAGAQAPLIAGRVGGPDLLPAGSGQSHAGQSHAGHALNVEPGASVIVSGLKPTHMPATGG
ncbi:MAG: hypothetical protein C0513_01650 [Isosphaera sp.]|nr:hypothetical protein [Isosphaera sp.]